eukprot:5508444-Amphidinium_carterae.1
MREHNVVELSTEPGLYVRRSPNGGPILVLHSHVDDALVAIDGSEESRDLLHKLSEALNAGETLEEVTEEPRRHLGRVIFRDDQGRCVVQQEVKIEGIEKPHDSEDETRVLSEGELSQYRSL